VIRLPKVFRRRPVRRCVRGFCQVVRERDFRLVADSIENLSEEGMQAGPADPVLTGEVLLVSFQIPQFEVWVDTEALVSRVIHGRRPGEHSRSVGLEFMELHPWHRYLLQQALKQVPPAPVGARTGRRAPMSMRDIARLMPNAAPAMS
jgi:hypothetical protein